MSDSWRDPIVSGIRRIREEYAARFHYDIDAICLAAREKQATSGRKVVTLPPKPAANGTRAGERGRS